MSSLVAGISLATALAFGDEFDTFKYMAAGFGGVAVVGFGVSLIIPLASDSKWTVGIETDAVKLKR